MMMGEAGTSSCGCKTAAATAVAWKRAGHAWRVQSVLRSPHGALPRRSVRPAADAEDGPGELHRGCRPASAAAYLVPRRLPPVARAAGYAPLPPLRRGHRGGFPAGRPPPAITNWSVSRPTTSIAAVTSSGSSHVDDRGRCGAWLAAESVPCRRRAQLQGVLTGIMNPRLAAKVAARAGGRGSLPVARASAMTTGTTIVALAVLLVNSLVSTATIAATATSTVPAPGAVGNHSRDRLADGRGEAGGKQSSPSASAAPVEEHDIQSIWASCQARARRRLPSGRRSPGRRRSRIAR